MRVGLGGTHQGRHPDSAAAGDAYVYDVLGAWDFVVADPDGKLGGPRSSDLVGVMGFSKGAFVSTTAFGMEGRIPGAWADGGPFTPEAVFKHGARTRRGAMKRAARATPEQGPGAAPSEASSLERLALGVCAWAHGAASAEVGPRGPATVRRPS